MWEELISNEVWLNKSFMGSSLFDSVKGTIESSSYQRLKPEESIRKAFESIDINPTLYDYTVHRARVRENQEVVHFYKSQLNLLFKSIGHEEFVTETMQPLQLFAKSFSPESFYEIHAEPVSKYGTMAFVHFLEDCDGGELVFPDEVMTEEFLRTSRDQARALEKTRNVFEKLGENLRWIGPLSVNPKKNHCVVFRVGSVHWVNKPIGPRNRRIAMTGWPFVSPKLIDDLDNTCKLRSVFLNG